jgi:mRNA-degrading endonuclease RelE of RelBE toxin-antitoxin system
VDLGALARRDRTMAGRISAAVDRFAESDVGDVAKLAGRADEWRLRVGTWRVIFTLDVGTVVILRVLARREAYRDR